MSKAKRSGGMAGGVGGVVRMEVDRSGLFGTPLVGLRFFFFLSASFSCVAFSFFAMC
jgi:hypothetical protein